MTRIYKTTITLSSVLVLVVSFFLPAPVLLPYPLFVMAYYRGWRFPQIGISAVRLLLSTLACTFVLEFCAWLQNFIRNTPDPALFHPQLIPDLIISLGVYVAWWLAWWLVLQRYHFTTLQVFITTGLYGVLIEQGGKVFLAGFELFPLGLFYWLVVIVAYGSSMALALFLVRDNFNATRDHWLKYPLTWVLLLVLTIATSLIWKLILNGLSIIPPEKFPMRAHPLW